MKFQAASSAAGPELGDYTQWVRWRAPTEKDRNLKKKKETHPDGCPHGQMRSGAELEGVALRAQL